QFMLGINEPPKQAMSVGGIRRWKDGRNMPDVHATIYYYGATDLPVYMRLNLGTEMPEQYRIQGSKGVLEVSGNTLTFTPQDGKDRWPSYYTGSYPRALRDVYDTQWHKEHDLQAGQAPPLTETVSFSTPDFDDTRPHLWNFFEAVRTREPGIAPFHRFARRESADLENAGLRALGEPAPGDRAVCARGHDVEHDRPAEEVCFHRAVGRVAQTQDNENSGPDAGPRRGRDGKLKCHGVTCSGPSSSSTFLSGLNTSSVPDELPPHSTPASAFPDVYTGEPLSPAPTIWTEFSTIVWQIWVIFDPETLTVAHVAVTVPCVQPVVRPTLLMVSPIEK